jgi:hypothetical protein
VHALVPSALARLCRTAARVVCAGWFASCAEASSKVCADSAHFRGESWGVGIGSGDAAPGAVLMMCRGRGMLVRRGRLGLDRVRGFSRVIVNSQCDHIQPPCPQRRAVIEGDCSLHVI